MRNLIALNNVKIANEEKIELCTIERKIRKSFKIYSQKTKKGRSICKAHICMDMSQVLY